MRDLSKDDILSIPEDVTINIKSRIVTVKGPRGELTKNLRHLNMEIKFVEDNKLKFVVYHGNRKHVACIRTVRSIINNMIIGVTKGFEYKMRYVYAHFPINVIIADDAKEVEIRNFLGQKVSFRVKMLDGVTVSQSATQKDELVLTGNDLDAVSQSGTVPYYDDIVGFVQTANLFHVIAATIQQTTSVKRKDIRKVMINLDMCMFVFPNINFKSSSLMVSTSLSVTSWKPQHKPKKYFTWRPCLTDEASF